MGVTPLASDYKQITRLRNVLLLGVGLDLLLILLRVLLYLPLFKEKDSGIYVVEPVVLLLVYIGIIWQSTRYPSLRLYLALFVGTAVGLLTGLLWSMSLLIETFVELKGVFSLLISATLMFGSFLCWGIAGLLGARKTQSFAFGILAALWSAMVGILILVTLGWLLTYVALPHLGDQIANDPDFLRSHWTDRQAFAIANAFDAGFSHLLGALIIGTTVGMIGSLIGILSLQGKQVDIDGSSSARRDS